MFRSISLRTLTVSFLCTFALLSSSYAQQRFSAGPRVGLNLSKFNGDVEKNNFHPGFTAGAFLMYSSLNHFGISVDALYAQRGAAFRVSRPGTYISYNQRINYLEIPVALRYFLTLSGNFRPNLFVGPSLAFRLNAKTTPVEASMSNSVVNTSTFNSADLGLIGGFQLNWKGLGERQRFLIDARYTYGFTDATALPIVGGLNKQRIGLSTVTVTLGYGFGVGPEYRSRFKR